MNPYLGHFDWDILYMTCFGVGFVLSVVGFISGFIHWHIGDFRFGHLHSLKASAGGRGGPIAPVNGFTIVAFLCWFGGTGYLLAHGRMAGALVLSLSLLSGLVGAGLVFWFFAKVMLPRERSLEPSDTPIIGVLGRVSSPVPAGGVGEMLYSQGGARRSIPIAAEDGCGDWAQCGGRGAAVCARDRVCAALGRDAADPAGGCTGVVDYRSGQGAWKWIGRRAGRRIGDGASGK